MQISSTKDTNQLALYPLISMILMIQLDWNYSNGKRQMGSNMRDSQREAQGTIGRRQ